jgi:broad specificity phosphatase PhoE
MAVTIIRHGERMDKALPGVWEDYCYRQFRHEPLKLSCRIKDPPLTRKGMQEARQAGENILKDIEQTSFIFSSKMTRTVQTAYEIAQLTGKPIVTSRAFALSGDVEFDGDFEFLSVEELRFLCPGVEIIDGDLEDEIRIPQGSWSECIEYVAERYPSSVIVAHKETICRLCGGNKIIVPFGTSAVFDMGRDKRFDCRTAVLSRMVDTNGANINLVVESERTSKRRSDGMTIPPS